MNHRLGETYMENQQRRFTSTSKNRNIVDRVNFYTFLTAVVTTVNLRYPTGISQIPQDELEHVTDDALTCVVIAQERWEQIVREFGEESRRAA